MKIQDALDIIDELRYTAEREHTLTYDNCSSTNDATYEKMKQDWYELDKRIDNLRNAVETQGINY